MISSEARFDLEEIADMYGVHDAMYAFLISYLNDANCSLDRLIHVLPFLCMNISLIVMYPEKCSYAVCNH